MVIAFCADFLGRWEGAVVDCWVEVEVEECKDGGEEEDAEDSEGMRERGHYAIASRAEEMFIRKGGGTCIYSNNNVCGRERGGGAVLP